MPGLVLFPRIAKSWKIGRSNLHSFSMNSAQDPPATRRPVFVGIFILILAGVLGLACVVAVVGPTKLLQHAFLLLGEDTAYAPGYSEKAFQEVQIGSSKEAVVAHLGNPLREDSAAPHTLWIYSPTPQASFKTSGQPDAMSTYTVFKFGTNGVLTDVYGQVLESSEKGLFGVQTTISMGNGSNSLSLTRKQIDALTTAGITPEAIEARFGAPQAQFNTQVSTWLIYSHSPGSKDYRLRWIGVDSAGKVSRKRSEIYWD